MTGSGLGSTPVGPNKLSAKQRAALGDLSKGVQSSLEKNVIYTKYAGKWMGNYDIKYARGLTDNADRFLLQAFGLEDYWDDIELAYARFMKMTGERPGTVREIPNFTTPRKASKAAEDAPEYG